MRLPMLAALGGAAGPRLALGGGAEATATSDRAVAKTAGRARSRTARWRRAVVLVAAVMVVLAGCGSLPSAWKNHRAWAPAGVPGNTGPEPADGRGLPHPASTTMTAATRTTARRHLAVRDRARLAVFATAPSDVAVASAPPPSASLGPAAPPRAASIGSLITPSPSDEAPAGQVLEAATPPQVSAGAASARKRPRHIGPFAYRPGEATSLM